MGLSGFRLLVSFIGVFPLPLVFVLLVWMATRIPVEAVLGSVSLRLGKDYTIVVFNIEDLAMMCGGDDIAKAMLCRYTCISMF